MNMIEELQYEISRSINTFRRRHANTADVSERRTLAETIDSLNGRLASMDRPGLLPAVETLADATEDLERAVGAARRGPFDGYLAAVEEHLNRLYRLSGAMHGREGLPPAPEEGEQVPSARRLRAVARRGLPGGLQPPQPVKVYDLLREEYQAYFDACEVRPGQEGTLAYYGKRLDRGREIYEQVGQDLNDIPWAFIGIIHGMECGFNFGGHLHNGDPLTARTVQVPAGRPQIGAPPFTWRQSAVDAMTMKGFHDVTDWSVPHMLYLLERYNGMGYRMRRFPSPYLWSFSNLYTKGKFVRDGVFDPEAVSKQCGAGLILKAIESRERPAGRAVRGRKKGRRKRS